MKKTTETLRGNYFFKQDELIHVNRNDENFVGPFHDHDFLEIAYIVEGEGFHHIGESVQKVRKGELFYLPIGISHVFRPKSTSGQKLVVINCLFSHSLMPKLIAFASEKQTVDFLWRMRDGLLGNYSVRDRNDRFERLFQSMFEQYSTPAPGCEDMLHALLFQLVVELHRSMSESEKTDQSLPKEAAFQDLLHYLRNNCEQELTLSHLAHLSGFSARHLQRLFHQHTGQSWFKYWQSVRVRRSSELLLRTSDKIQHIAEAVGYKDIHSFNTVFKRLTGLTPSQYRKRD
ncbi:helix-turn-helix domain-containing protein [Paenibacillus sp. PAMC21692]|uniref:helix-turn-helix domain-containing protein n=1 Tax=Paenibacillus sp. PAMC21692 TaxID=2762320 RepID=UPI00164ECD3C|nr:helix-turn-helix domain-containing protein [Paenibacillus sp. PAMC21692]QNK60113.1 helix-turn-helix domain-containing protein [Paenibacillus sp. PAMC21692]